MRKLKKKLKRPKTPWDLNEIKEDKGILREFGLRRKREIWSAQEVLRQFRQRARELNAVRNEEKEKTLLEKVVKLGMLEKDKKLDDVLTLDIKNLLERRLQTMVFRKGMAKTIKQARQMIVHGHIAIDEKRVIYPSYIVPVEEESKIGLYGKPATKPIGKAG